MLTPGTLLPFPKFYPISVLLGCVEVVDCLSHDQLQKCKTAQKDEDVDSTTSKVLHDIPLDEENDSDFVFVCVNPHRLVVPMAVSGQHKLCEHLYSDFCNRLGKLPKGLHQAAKEGIVPIKKEAQDKP